MRCVTMGHAEDQGELNSGSRVGSRWVKLWVTVGHAVGNGRSCLESRDGLR